MCAVPGCQEPLCAKGMCKIHYMRWYRYGDPVASHIRTRAPHGEPLRYLLAHMYDGCCGATWPYAKAKGYPRATDDGRLRYAANIVCEMVNGPCPDGQECRHRCGLGHKGCFNADCLEWGLRLENIHDAIRHGTWPHGDRHGSTRLPMKDVEKLLRMHDTGRYLHRELAEMFCICRSHVTDIINSKSRRNG